MLRTTTLLLLLTLCGLAARLDAQDATAPRTADFAPEEVARIGDQSIRFDAFHAYVGSNYARDATGTAALQQLHIEKLIDDAARLADIVISRADVDEVVTALEARDGNSLDSMRENPAFEIALYRLARQVELLRIDRGLDFEEALDPTVQREWLEAAAGAAPLRIHELNDPIAADWDGGEITREELGVRILDLSPAEERGGLLTEFLGVLLIHGRARGLGIELDPEEAAAVLAEREVLIKAQPELAGISYADVLKQTEGLEITELVASPRFAAEVLLRQMVDRNWNEMALRELFETERAAFEERLSSGVSFEAARDVVLRDVRQRSYQKLMLDSRIERRF